MKGKQESPTSKRYGEAFKRTVVNDIESGKTTILAVRKQYGITGGVTIPRWIRRYGRKSMSKTTRVSKKNIASKPLSNSARLERENRELKAALAQVTMEKVLLESLVTVAQEELGIDLQKNFGLRR
jgi:transposase-like protein